MSTIRRPAIFHLVGRSRTPLTPAFSSLSCESVSIAKSCNRATLVSMLFGIYISAAKSAGMHAWKDGAEDDELRKITTLRDIYETIDNNAQPKRSSGSLPNEASGKAGAATPAQIELGQTSSGPGVNSVPIPEAPQPSNVAVSSEGYLSTKPEKEGESIDQPKSPVAAHIMHSAKLESPICKVEFEMVKTFINRRAQKIKLESTVAQGLTPLPGDCVQSLAKQFMVLRCQKAINEVCVRMAVERPFDTAAPLPEDDPIVIDDGFAYLAETGVLPPAMPCADDSAQAILRKLRADLNSRKAQDAQVAIPA